MSEKLVCSILTDFKMDIYLLRHGLSTSNEKRLVCGAADYPLSETGRIQAKRICDHLGNIPFTRIYSSPLSRALQTIEKLQRQVEINIAPELIELDTGEVSHISVDELWAREPRYRYQGLHPNLKYPSGECLHDMLTRVADWFDSAMLTWAKSDTVLIAGHEGTVCGILHKLLSLDISHYPTFLIGNCDYVQVELNEDGQIRYRFVALASIA